MEGEYEFIGREYEDDEKKNLGEGLRRCSEKATETIEGELEKNQGDLKIIEITNLILKDELETLGINTFTSIPPDRVHILPGAVFAEKFPDKKGNAFFRTIEDALFINRDKVDTTARMISTLLHEIIHRASVRKFYADKDGAVYDARVGYRIRSAWKQPDRENRLLGFNELMTDYTVFKILIKNQKLLEHNFGITEADIRGPIYSYMHYGPILKYIVEKISLNKGISSQQSFTDLERGQFESNILVLKDVEKSFGKGSLEILSLLGTLKEAEDNDGMDEMVKRFFAEEDELKRQNIRSEILTFVDGKMTLKDGTDRVTQ